ncbi:type II toxin-antitoxin system VapC family toxin [Candidatus Bathyarchaeota archaeon]|nr:type II toxin-antitoxin system VapC family toxin [Candidatus Bathyarchaeota archaeon]
MYLYNTGAVLNLVKRGCVKVFVEGCTIDLAIYEAINAVWKECYILKKINVEVVYKLIELLSKIFNILDSYSIRGSEREVLEIAVKEGITVYDTSYIYIVVRDKLTLVTDDKKLINTAKKYVNIATTTQITI